MKINNNREDDDDDENIKIILFFCVFSIISIKLKLLSKNNKRDAPMDDAV